MTGLKERRALMVVVGVEGYDKDYVEIFTIKDLLEG